MTFYVGRRTAENLDYGKLDEFFEVVLYSEIVDPVGGEVRRERVVMGESDLR